MGISLQFLLLIHVLVDTFLIHRFENYYVIELKYSLMKSIILYDFS